jgi:hypothetical protein
MLTCCVLGLSCLAFQSQLGKLKLLLAVRDNLISSPVSELQTDCEIIWCKLELVGHKVIYLTSYYNPKTSNEESYRQFEISMNHATSIKNAVLIAAGDFNLPSWD